MYGKGYEDRFLSEHEIREILNAALGHARLSGKRELIIIPDSTRTAPIPQMFRLFYEALGKEAAALDYLIAAFRESALWGLAVLFVSPASIAFLILHWQAAKSSFFLQLYGVGFVVAGAVFCDGHVPGLL